jgi:hypothetical protein
MHNNSHTETNKGRANALRHRATDEPSRVSPSRPSGSVSTFAAFQDALLRPSENVEWLMQAGPIAARLNAESRAENEAHNREAGSAEQAPATHHGD